MASCHCATATSSSFTSSHHHLVHGIKATKALSRAAEVISAAPQDSRERGQGNERKAPRYELLMRCIFKCHQVLTH